MPIEEDEPSFLARRAAEERSKVEQTSCIVRSVHEEMVELYEERSGDAAAETAALEDLLKKID